jgi:transcriptional regulator with XRE-family HTH domain
MVHHSIGAVLRRVRIKRGMSLKTVARRAGTTFGYLSQVERGDKSPSSEMIWNICAALNVPVSTVLLEASVLLAEKERREREYAA